MRATLNIDDELLSKAAQMTGVQGKTRLVRLGLEALVARESAGGWPNWVALRRS